MRRATDEEKRFAQRHLRLRILQHAALWGPIVAGCAYALIDGTLGSPFAPLGGAATPGALAAAGLFAACLAGQVWILRFYLRAVRLDDAVETLRGGLGEAQYGRGDDRRYVLTFGGDSVRLPPTWLERATRAGRDPQTAYALRAPGGRADSAMRPSCYVIGFDGGPRLGEDLARGAAGRAILISPLALFCVSALVTAFFAEADRFDAGRLAYDRFGPPPRHVVDAEEALFGGEGAVRIEQAWVARVRAEPTSGPWGLPPDPAALRGEANTRYDRAYAVSAAARAALLAEAAPPAMPETELSPLQQRLIETMNAPDSVKAALVERLLAQQRLPASDAPVVSMAAIAERDRYFEVERALLPEDWETRIGAQSLSGPVAIEGFLTANAPNTYDGALRLIGMAEGERRMRAIGLEWLERGLFWFLGLALAAALGVLAWNWRLARRAGALIAAPPRKR